MDLYFAEEFMAQKAIKSKRSHSSLFEPGIGCIEFRRNKNMRKKEMKFSFYFFNNLVFFK